jgi:hypothetical protein
LEISLRKVLLAPIRHFRFLVVGRSAHNLLDGENQMTTLTAKALNDLTAMITGKPAGRVANLKAAEGRFRREAAKAGYDADAILATGNSFDAAGELQNQMQDAEDARNAEDAAAAERDARIVAAAATMTSPGLARLRAHPKAEAIRQETQAEAAAVIAGVYPFEKARSRAKAALAVIEAEAPAPEKVAKPKKERPAKVKAEKPEGRAARVSAADTAVITTVASNPKKPGSRAHARFALYSAGQTVAAFIEACVKAGYPEREARADISWDRRKGFISIGAEAAAAA